MNLPVQYKKSWKTTSVVIQGLMFHCFYDQQSSYLANSTCWAGCSRPCRPEYEIKLGLCEADFIFVNDWCELYISVATLVSSVFVKIISLVYGLCVMLSPDLNRIILFL